MKWILLLPLAAGCAEARTYAQTYVKPYSLSVAMSEKFEHKIIGPTVTKSPYEFDDAISIGINYRTLRDSIKLGLSYSHTIQNGNDTVTAEIRYNIIQWGRRPIKRIETPAP